MKILWPFLCSLIIWQSLAEGSQASLNLAHSAYRQGDFKSMNRYLKQTLEESSKDPIISQNAVELFKTARRSQLALPVDWQVPKDIKKLQVKFQSGLDSENFFYSIRLESLLANKGELVQMKMVRFPNEIVLDLKNQLGEFEEELDTDENMWNNELTSARQKEPFSTGLYTIYVELKNGVSMNGWFILDDESFSSQAPSIHDPKQGATLVTQRPTIKFDNFTSPQYAGIENRSFYSHVGSMKGDVWGIDWSFWEADPNRQSIVVEKTLKPGRYNLYLSFAEKTLLGDLRLNRVSYNKTNFNIR